MVYNMFRRFRGFILVSLFHKFSWFHWNIFGVFFTLSVSVF